jgi:hypothetical protein
MAIITWTPITGEYTATYNWAEGVLPTNKDAAFFNGANVTSVVVSSSVEVGEWVFNAAGYEYTVQLLSEPHRTDVLFYGAGIVVNGGLADIVVGQGSGTFPLSNALSFLNYSTGSSASISILSGQVYFEDVSTSGSANIVIYSGSYLLFADYSFAGTATIHTLVGGIADFAGNSSAGSAQLINDAGGDVIFESLGPAIDHKLTAGSIAGAGTYHLGSDQLTVGLKGVSTNVSGLIDGSGGSLVIRAGSLTLSNAGNTFSADTTLVL